MTGGYSASCLSAAMATWTCVRRSTRCGMRRSTRCGGPQSEAGGSMLRPGFRFDASSDVDLKGLTVRSEGLLLQLLQV